MGVNPSFEVVDANPEAAWPDTVAGLQSAGGPASYVDYAVDSSDVPPVQMLDPDRLNRPARHQQDA